LARDATQQTLLTAWQELPRLRDPDRFEAWICRILVRDCHREGRKASRWLPVLPDRPGPDPVVVDSSGLVITRDRLERAFCRLNLDQRLAVVLHYYLDLPPAIIADRLDIPVGTVHSRLHRALHAMHAAIDADERIVVPVTSPPARVRQETVR
jgi:RNA polymerase sigma factor (sigma-70 family)